MKILSIGDLHGLDVWKRFGDIPQLIAAPFEPDFDYYVFMGDYTDSWTETNVTILHNLTEIIAFKDAYPDNVILLWGNHEMSYLKNMGEQSCSGFRPEAYYDLHDVLRTNRHKFQLAFGIGNYLWTHAGVHAGWYKYEFPYDSPDVASDLNMAFEQNVKSIFDVSFSRGGFKRVGGPLWADKSEITKKPLMGYHQIVGHTRVPEIKTYDNFRGDTSVTIIDCLENGTLTPHILEI